MSTDKQNGNLRTKAKLTPVTQSLDLPMWPSGQSSRAPCAVERDALSGHSSNLSPGASAYHRIISNNSYAPDEQGDNPG